MKRYLFTLLVALVAQCVFIVFCAAIGFELPLTIYYLPNIFIWWFLPPSVIDFVKSLPHFLSDVVFALPVALIISLICAAWAYQPKPEVE